MQSAVAYEGVILRTETKTAGIFENGIYQF